MNDCERLSDRMPGVALQRDEWTAEVAAHLSGCAECLAEWRLLLAARALDEDAPTVSDLSALSAALQRRLAEDRAGRGRARRAWSFAGAAALAAAVVVAVVIGSEREPAGPPRTVARAEALIPLPELEGLEAAQLDTLLQSIDRPSTGRSTLDASTLGEHEDGELEQVFATWEG
jgi:hypothetical protein